MAFRVKPENSRPSKALAQTPDPALPLSAKGGAYFNARERAALA